MSNNSANPLQDFIELRAKNLNFFRSYYPGIYEFFSTYQLKGSKLDILPETNEVDLIVDGGSLYSKRAKQYAKREMAAFLNAYDYGTKVKSVRPLAKDTYTNRRLFARSISGLYEQYYEKFQGSVPFGGYQLPDFFPLVVFMGCGLGLHIQYLASIRDIRHCLILETDMDRFAGSFYCVDWEQTLMPFLSDPARSCKFILLPDLQDEQLIYGAVWNELIRMCPIFPLTTLFYNHLSNPVFDRVSDRINRDIYVHLFSFGNFDDEINQLNNTLHNFRRGVSLIGKPDQNHLDLPVCIVGSGPSLESRQAELKSIQNKVLIISCGTALGALLKLGIVPDIQVELESDYVTYTLHAQLEHVEKLKDVRLLGAAQLNPLLFELFGTAKVFFKSDGALAYWFEKQEQAIPNATPTCTNAALAICLHFGFKNILLFGLDYGFPDKKDHHASGSVYYHPNMEENISIDDHTLLSLPCSAGGTVLTTNFLYTAKRRTETVLSLMAGQQQIVNCSNGAVIEHTIWSDNARTLVKHVNIDKQTVLNLWLGDSVGTESTDLIASAKRALKTEIDQFYFELESRISSQSIDSIRAYCDFCSSVISLLTDIEGQKPGLYFFLRGTIWHYLYAGYSHVFSIEDPSQQRSYLAYWVETLSFFLEESRLDIDTVLSNDLSIYHDDRVVNTISLPTAKDRDRELSKLKWDFTGAVIENGTLCIDKVEWDYAGYCFNGDTFMAYNQLK